jgi:hypothetical protein
MRIEEIIRSCASDDVAEAAVACIGHKFSAEVRDRAKTYGMSLGAFTSLAVDRFLRHGDEGELRSVAEAMRGAQEPVLAGLHCILRIMLAAGGVVHERRRVDRLPRLSVQFAGAELDARPDHIF